MVCSICLEDCDHRPLPCGHPAHQHCITEWLQLNAVCPVCRAPSDTPKIRCHYCPREWGVSEGRVRDAEARREVHETTEHPREYFSIGGGASGGGSLGGGLGGRGWRPGDPITDGGPYYSGTAAQQVDRIFAQLLADFDLSDEEVNPSPTIRTPTQPRQRPQPDPRRSTAPGQHHSAAPRPPRAPRWTPDAVSADPADAISSAIEALRAFAAVDSDLSSSSGEGVRVQPAPRRSGAQRRRRRRAAAAAREAGAGAGAPTVGAAMRDAELLLAQLETSAEEPAGRPAAATAAATAPATQQRRRRGRRRR